MVAHSGIVVGHFGIEEVDRFETVEMDRSGMRVAVPSENLVKARFGNWEGRSGIEAETLAQGVVEIAVAVGSLGRSGREEVQAD